MQRPVPTQIFHFTHLRNLPGMVARGMVCDTDCAASSLTAVEVGSSEIKAKRRRKPVPVGPGGVVADYVPFYYAPRSPMMYTLTRNNYEYTGGFDDVVYLCSSLEALDVAGRPWIASDRNAAQDFATFVVGFDQVDGHVDWPLMKQRQWGYTNEDPSRPDRRAAECLAFRSVPWEAIERIVAKNNAAADMVRRLLVDAVHQPRVSVDADWYF
jgi:hypothetical protein